MQSYRRAESKETQRTAFILPVSAGRENSSVDMCVSGDAVWSPGKQRRDLLDQARCFRLPALNICRNVDLLVTLILSFLCLVWVSE